LLDCPVGQLCIQGDGQFVTGLFMPNHKGWSGIDTTWQKSDAAFVDVRKQIEQYFAGDLQQFDVPLKLIGTDFQQQVWQELVRIPFGTTITYGQLADRIGNRSASRAVGQANSKNPISIIVPCHRVIGSNGTLTGYAGGIDGKERLLEWERSTLDRKFSRRLQKQLFPASTD
jgi:methylated-DNA-[protein]-cysteine S-methyltransferase